MTNLKKSVTMRQPDTSALRERLNNYTPGQELNEDKQVLEGLLQEVSDQILAIRNLLKEINTVKEELEKVNNALSATSRRKKHGGKDLSSGMTRLPTSSAGSSRRLRRHTDC